MKPKIGVLLGDPNGVGPEMAVKLLAGEDVRERADILVIGDQRILRMAEKVAGISVPADVPFLDVPSITLDEITPGEATAAGGRACLESLSVALDMAKKGEIDGFCFAPLNKYALKLGGCPVADEHIFFARELDFDGPFCEHNVLDDLWTTRTTSHIPMSEVCALITPERILRAIRLAHNTLGSAGFEKPRIAVAALNPHAGDGGMFGREEIDIIAPTIETAKA